MIISETFSLEGSRERVAALLCDVNRVGSCVPGMSDVAHVAPNEYEATLLVRVGPVKAAFRGSITIDDSEGPGRLRAAARGKDRAGGSMASINFDARLEESAPNLTTVETSADVTIRGRLGGFGTGVIQATAKQMIGDFVSCVDGRLSPARSSPPETSARPVPVLRSVFLALCSRLRSRFGSRRKPREKSTR